MAYKQPSHLSWHCPVCQHPLHTDHTPWQCDNRHSFDVSKQGHVNLLLAHHKRSKNPGDSKAMLHARRQFLEAGYYQPLIQNITDCLRQHVPPNDTPFRLLDSGCGEGYYLDQIASQLHHAVVAGGFDIAKDAVQIAAKQYPHWDWVCASSKQIPLSDHSIDGVVNVFAPTAEAELKRVLSPEGALIVVGPGPQHLMEIKKTIYDTIKPYSTPITPKGFTHLSQSAVTFNVEIKKKEDWENLLTMTPFFHRGNSQSKQQLLSAPPSSLRCDFIVSVYQPTISA